MSAEERQRPYFTTPPDWVCEVASKSTTNRDRRVKAPCYAAHGVNYLWLVEPVDERIEAFERVDARWLWLGTWSEDTAAAIAPFDAVPLDLVELWSAKGLRATGS